MLNPFRTRQNNINIQTQIELKRNLSKPYYATQGIVGDVISEYNVFPFNRWYKGQAFSTLPIVDERNAGWRIAQSPQLEQINEKSMTKNMSFEAPCSTIFPSTKATNMPTSVFLGASV